MRNKMKSSGIEWVGDIPSDWDVKPVKYILESNQKTLSETTKKDYIFRYIDIGSVDFDKGITNYEEMNFENAPSRARRIVKKGDTIISTVRTYLKAIARIKEDKDIIVSTGFAVLSPKNNESGFIEYYCKSDVFCSEIEKLSYGIAYPAINESVLVNIKMILPPPAEQKAIAAFLDTQCDKIYNIITDLEQQIEILKQYKTSLITEIVTKGLNKDAPMKDSGIDWIEKIPAHWEVMKLKYIIELKSGDGLTNDLLSDDDVLYPVFGGGGQMGYYMKSNVTSNNILIGRVGANCGCITKITRKSWATDNALIVSSKVNLNYLYYILLTTDLNNMSEKNAQPLIIASKVLNYRIPFSSDVQTQKTIAAFLDGKCKEISDIITEKHQSIDAMKAYKKSLIYEYVTGKKRVKGYS